MRVLIACEESGIVRDAFIAAGASAWSCDLQPTRRHGPHIQGDVLAVLAASGTHKGAKFAPWDLLIGHPPCTRLANSGVLRLYVGSKKAGGLDPGKIVEMIAARRFFLALWRADVPRICIENPIPHFRAELPPYTQTIQPFEFGDPESKRTCLWLKNLPRLVPTKVLALPKCGHWSNQCPGGQNKLGPSARRAQIRAQTYRGIAAAMAAQWTRLDASPELPGLTSDRMNRPE